MLYNNYAFYDKKLVFYNEITVFIFWQVIIIK